MSILSRLFGGKGGGSAETSAEPVLHEGYRIFAEPVKEASGWRLNARIEKEIAGETKVHQLIRADTFDGKDAAIEATIAKAHQVIDQMGEQIFS